MLAIFKREFRSYFTTPIGYIFIAAFNLLLGLFFTMAYSYGVPDITFIITSVFSVEMIIGAFGLLAISILTSRIMSDDKRQKVDQVLLTAPVKLSSIVLGKFFAALTVFFLGFSVIIIYEIIFACVATVEILPFIYILIGTMLLGGALIALGMFISSLTESVIVSAFLSFVINLFVLNISVLSGNITAPTGDDWFSKALAWLVNQLKDFLNELDFINAYTSFSENMFSVVDIIYFLSIISFFLFMCVRSLEKRRWS